nr:hypothetical protein Iba_chr10fCG11030 [Ipomoea batatas]
MKSTIDSNEVAQSFSSPIIAGASHSSRVFFMTRASSESGDREKRERIWGSFTAENGIFPAAERGVGGFGEVQFHLVALLRKLRRHSSACGTPQLCHLFPCFWTLRLRISGALPFSSRPQLKLPTQLLFSHHCRLFAFFEGFLHDPGFFRVRGQRETGENLGEFHGGKRDFSGGRAREESGGVAGFGEVQFHVVALLQVILLEEKGHVGVVVELILRRGVDVVEGIRAGRDADEDWLAAVVAADDYAALPNAHCQVACAAASTAVVLPRRETAVGETRETTRSLLRRRAKTGDLVDLCCVGSKSWLLLLRQAAGRDKRKVRGMEVENCYLSAVPSAAVRDKRKVRGREVDCRRLELER